MSVQGGPHSLRPIGDENFVITLKKALGCVLLTPKARTRMQDQPKISMVFPEPMVHPKIPKSEGSPHSFLRQVVSSVIPLAKLTRYYMILWGEQSGLQRSTATVLQANTNP